MDDPTTGSGRDEDPEVEDDRSVVSQVADLVVYAPLGLAFDARDLFPDLVSKGRNQATIFKMLGRFAVQQGSHKGRSTLSEIGGQAISMIPGVSVGDAPDEVDDTAAELGTERSEPRARPLGIVPSDPVVPAASTTPEASAEAEDPSEAAPAVDVSTLAIPDYDSLSALQVVPRLEGLTTTELEAVRAYEAGTRARRTILNKVAQLQTG